MNIIKNLYHKYSSRNIKLSYLTFSLLFTALSSIVWNGININKFSKWFYIGNSFDYFGIVIFFLVGLSLFFFFFVMLTFHRWLIKPISIIFIVLSSATTYFISKYNIAVESSMLLNVVNTDTTEVKSLLSVHMIPYIFFLIILPILIIIKVDVVFNKKAKHLIYSMFFLIFSFCASIGLIYISFDSIHRAGNISKKYILYQFTPINYIVAGLALLQEGIVKIYPNDKEDVVFSGYVSSQEDLMVVLAIGETSRQKNFTLYQYDRKNTNPALSKIKDLHVLNGIARFGSTHYALSEILEKKGMKLPTITNKVGIDTFCYVNYSLDGRCDAVGEIKVHDCNHKGKCYDEDVLPLLEKNIKSYVSGYRFVVLHLGGGSHGPIYSDRHPPEFQKFKPLCLSADVINECTKEELYNSYDNTILYVDYVLNEIIQKLEKSQLPYVFIFLSDHGESLLENGRIFHGMPPGISLPPEQAKVPLMIKSSIPISIVKRDKYLQQNIFNTVLDLFSIETSLFKKENSFIKKR